LSGPFRSQRGSIGAHAAGRQACSPLLRAHLERSGGPCGPHTIRTALFSPLSDLFPALLLFRPTFPSGSSGSGDSLPSFLPRSVRWHSGRVGIRSGAVCRGLGLGCGPERTPNGRRGGFRASFGSPQAAAEVWFRIGVARRAAFGLPCVGSTFAPLDPEFAAALVWRRLGTRLGVRGHRLQSGPPRRVQGICRIPFDTCNDPAAHASIDLQYQPLYGGSVPSCPSRIASRACSTA
jgi:hypothetical protein